MADGARRLVFPQDSAPAGDRPEKVVDDALSPSPAETRSGARRLVIPDATEARPEGARRIQIPESTMSDDRRSRRLNIPDQTPPATPVESDGRARRLLIDETPEPSAPASSERRRTTISPPEIAPVPTRQPRPQTLTDRLIEKAQGIDATVPMQRLRGRIDTILVMSVTDILDWGQRNLTPLQNTSSRKAKIAGDIARINAAQWLTEAKNASCKVPSFMDRFTAKPPSFYDGMLQKVRGELLQFVKELDSMKGEFFREVGDLHCDALAMMVCAEEFQDDNAKVTAHNRARTLLLSHQTAATLQQTIEMSLQQAAQFIQQIDDFLSITLPNWKMAYGAR